MKNMKAITKETKIGAKMHQRKCIFFTQFSFVQQLTYSQTAQHSKKKQVHTAQNAKNAKGHKY